MAKLQEIIANCSFDAEMVEDLVELAHVAGALPELVATLPQALSYGLGNFYKNWDIMIQDIYDLNPDVTLMVIGMSDNSLKGKYFGYNGEEGKPINAENTEPSAVATTIVEFIMSVGNGPMIESEEKFGYTYVDTAGTTYVESHPDADGHIHIANKIIEALPSVKAPSGDSDVTPDDNTGGDNTEKPPVDNSGNDTENNNDSNKANGNNGELPNTDTSFIIAPVVAVAVVSLATAIVVFTKRKRIEE